MCRWTFVAAGLLLTSSGAAIAGEINTAIVNADRYLSVEVGGLNQNYRETVGGSVPDKEQGTIPDIGIEYSVLGLDRPFRFELAANYASGDTNYIGSLMNGTPYDTTTRNGIIDAYAGLGYTFGYGTFALTPGILYGEHSWERNINYDTNPGYQERYGNQYVAATLDAQFALNQSTVLSLSGAYGSTVDPTMTSNLTPGGTYYLGVKPWVRAGLKLDYAAYSDLHIGLKISYTRFKYGASANGFSGLGEPDSETQQAIFNLTMGYNF